MHSAGISSVSHATSFTTGDESSTALSTSCEQSRPPPVEAAAGSPASHGRNDGIGAPVARDTQADGDTAAPVALVCV